MTIKKNLFKSFFLFLSLTIMFLLAVFTVNTTYTAQAVTPIYNFNPPNSNPSRPNPPQNLRATLINSNLVTIRWNAVPGAKYYEVYVNNKYNKTTTSLFYNVTGLLPSTKYDFKVRSYNGYTYSAFTNTLTVTTSTSSLGTPQNLRATSITGNSIALSWDPVPGATGYMLYKNNQLVNQPLLPKYTVTKLSPNTTYTFKVISMNSTAYSGYSNTITITTVNYMLY